MIRMEKLGVGQLVTVTSLLLLIEAQKMEIGSGSEKAQMTLGSTGCAENCEEVSPLGENQSRSKDGLAKNKDDDIQSLDNFQPKGQETKVSRREKERRRRKRKRRKKSQRRRGEQAGGRRRRKKHLREEKPFDRAEVKKKERMRRRRRLYEEQKEFQR